MVDFFGLSGFGLGGGVDLDFGSHFGTCFGEAVFIFGLAVVCRFGFFFQNFILSPFKHDVNCPVIQFSVHY